MLQVLQLIDGDTAANAKAEEAEREGKEQYQPDITYGIDDVPPWYLCIFMALQVILILSSRQRLCLY